MNLNLLLTDEEYQKRFTGNNHPSPYIYKLDYKKQILIYFGVSHSRNPEDSQWENLKRVGTTLSIRPAINK